MARALVVALLSVAVASVSTGSLALADGDGVASFEFSVCSGAGGAHGVDFRSHFSVYSVAHGLKGWVRNACNDCVYGTYDHTLDVS